MARILIVVGTRPEAIKLAPVILALRRLPGMAISVCATGQHAELAPQALAHFGIAPDIQLGRQPSQLDQLSASLIVGIGAAIDEVQADRVIVQGDTCSAMAGALAAHYRRIPVAHVEAGLRSGDLHHPWPEEANRRLVAVLADMHFAPTENAAAALRSENLPPSRIHVTGNTVIDALHHIRGQSEADLPVDTGGKRLVLVTCHRRESFGGGLGGIAAALRILSERTDIIMAIPVHPNPEVSGPLRAGLVGCPNIRLLDPLAYPAFVQLLAAAHLALTDSGGVQEEAPALGVPVLVLRDRTERTEGVAAGTARIVGRRRDAITAAANELLDDPAAHARMARAHSPYGDGLASERIAAFIAAAHADVLNA